MSFVVVFRAKTSALPANKPESNKEPAQDFFMNSSVSFAWYDPDTSSWKTSQQSLLTDLALYSESWPRQGMTLNGRAYALRIWEPVTVETDGGLLPTPTATGSERRTKFKQGGTPLMLALLPTPTARDHKDSGERVNYEKLAKKSRLAGILVTECSAQNGGATYLNPSFLEEMMGYPIGWTALEH